MATHPRAVRRAQSLHTVDTRDGRGPGDRHRDRHDQHRFRPSHLHVPDRRPFVNITVTLVDDHTLVREAIARKRAQAVPDINAIDPS